jgi:NRAMP (natural resistance-associated macrophage protein)-like metal ion transporter
MASLKRFIRAIGPGLITGAADDDPSGIATYSQTGAQFGLGLLWVTLLMLPFLIAIQELCARIGAQTGMGIAGIIKRHYSKWLLYPLVLLVLAANTFNISANLAAIVAAFQLLFPVNYYVLLFGSSIITIILEIFLNYKIYSKFLILLCLFLFAYPITLFIIKPPAFSLIKATFTPHLEFSFDFLLMLIALFGTTISPYLFFWQASEVIEEKEKRGIPKNHLKRSFLRDIRLDNFFGMLSSQVITWFIIAVAATTLHNQGIYNIGTAADAAKALEPLVHSFPNAGKLAEFIFAMGIIGSGFLSIPVLAGSSAFALGEALDWKVGINKRLRNAKGFYSIIILAMLGGIIIDLFNFEPIKLLVYSAIINGIIAVPLILILFLIGNNKKIMKNYTSKLISKILVGITFIAMTIIIVFEIFLFRI